MAGGLSAQKVLGTQQKRQHASQASASGNRIVRAGDDAAGLAISENIKSQVRGMQMARMNAFNAVSSIQVSEGGWMKTSNILTRLRELGIQAASDNVGERERGFLNIEAKNIIEEADRIAKTTVFGDKKLLDGSGGEKWNTMWASEAAKKTSLNLVFQLMLGPMNLAFRDSQSNPKGRPEIFLINGRWSCCQSGLTRANFGAIQIDSNQRQIT